MRKTITFLLLATAAAAAAPAAAQNAPGQDDPRQDRREGRQRGDQNGPGRDYRRGAGGDPRVAQPQAQPQQAQQQQRGDYRGERPDGRPGQGGYRQPGQDGGFGDGRNPNGYRGDDRRGPGGQYGRDDRRGPEDRYGRGDDRRGPDGRYGQNDRRGPDGRDWRGGNDGRDGRWNNGWRNDRRYDWQGYRSQNRNAYRMPRYYAPRGYGQDYRRFSSGYRLQPYYYGSGYWINDPWQYRLPPAYGSYRWVRYYNDVALVDIRSGLIADIIYSFFW
jgi:Ni/Co efflux regulator RcnB